MPPGIKVEVRRPSTSNQARHMEPGVKDVEDLLGVSCVCWTGATCPVHDMVELAIQLRRRGLQPSGQRYP